MVLYSSVRLSVYHPSSVDTLPFATILCRIELVVILTCRRMNDRGSPDRHAHIASPSFNLLLASCLNSPPYRLRYYLHHLNISPSLHHLDQSTSPPDAGTFSFLSPLTRRVQTRYRKLAAPQNICNDPKPLSCRLVEDLFVGFSEFPFSP